ncbi:MAG: GNAT family N-acetyltransferase, partial [Caulobacteraceae bacterium]|nr:GNAT family N-acetyltransferase [Caulobacteraceae bacterium]
MDNAERATGHATDWAGAATVVIRPARVDDAAAMAAYMTALAAEKLDTLSPAEPTSAADERERVLRSRISDRLLILLAVHGEALAGIASLAGGRRTDDRHAGRLGLSVARAWRGRGVGRLLLGATIEEARSWPGFCRIELECAPWNAPAIALYENLGFMLEGRRRKALDLRGEPEDMLLMSL